MAAVRREDARAARAGQARAGRRGGGARAGEGAAGLPGLDRFGRRARPPTHAPAATGGAGGRGRFGWCALGIALPIGGERPARGDGGGAARGGHPRTRPGARARRADAAGRDRGGSAPCAPTTPARALPWTVRVARLQDRLQRARPSARCAKGGLRPHRPRRRLPAAARRVVGRLRAGRDGSRAPACSSPTACGDVRTVVYGAAGASGSAPRRSRPRPASSH